MTILRSGAMFCLNGLGNEQRIYTLGDGDFGANFSIVNTPTPPSLGGDDVYWGQFMESAGGTSFAILTPRWSQDVTNWTIFGGMVRFGVNWPCNGFDCLMFELIGGGTVQAAIYGEASSGDIYLRDSGGAQAVSLANPIGVNEPFLIVGAVQLTDPGNSKLWVYNRLGALLASGTGTGDDFQTATGLTMFYRLQGQNHGGAPIGSPTTTFIMNPFVFDGSASGTDQPTQMAGMFYTCIDGDATPPFEYDGTTTDPEVGSAGVWSDTANQSAGSNLTYPQVGNGGMNVVDGPLNDVRLGPSTKIFGGGVCFHTDSASGFQGFTNVSAGRDDGSATVQDRVSLGGFPYGSSGDDHGATLLVDNIAYDERLAFGHRSSGFSPGNLSELNAGRGWIFVDPSTLVSGGIAILRRRIEGHA